MAERKGFSEAPPVIDSVGWRNASQTKTYDVDGNNVLGTDGYYMRGGTSAVSYLSSYVQNASGGNPFELIDDPANPTSNTFYAGFSGAKAASLKAFTFTIGTDQLDKTLGVSIHYDAFSSAGKYQEKFTLAQTAGVGSDSVTSSNLQINSDGSDWATFYITGAAAGDTFTMTMASTDGTANHWLQFDGVAFDSATTSAVPEPASFALALAGFGLLGFRRRRNRVA